MDVSTVTGNVKKAACTNVRIPKAPPVKPQKIYQTGTNKSEHI